MPSSIKILGVDVDDTLWQNAGLFWLAQNFFCKHASFLICPDSMHKPLMAAERCNLGVYEYVIRTFGLYMMKTAVNVSKFLVPACVVHDILKYKALYDRLSY